jgi:prepilin-type processing-associated H-X9-DG protein
VTRDVEVSALRDLLDHPSRATVAFVDGNAVSLLPARARCSATKHLFGVASATAPDLADREVVLVIDAGPYWFEARGISVRGIAARVEPSSRDGDLVWYTIEPRRVLAWDYGAIREE